MSLNNEMECLTLYCLLKSKVIKCVAGVFLIRGITRSEVN